MMRVVTTGADGFLGWHRSAYAGAQRPRVIPVDLAKWDSLGELVGSADAVLHFVGINSASEDYSIPNTSQRAVNFVVSTWRRQATWAGLRDAGADR